MADINDLRRSIQRLNRMQDLPTRGDAYRLLGDYGLGSQPEDIEAAIKRVDSLSEVIKANKQEGESLGYKPSLGNTSDIAIGQTVSHGSTTEGVQIAAGRRNSMRKSPSRRPTEEKAISSLGEKIPTK